MFRSYSEFNTASV